MNAYETLQEIIKNHPWAKFPDLALVGKCLRYSEQDIIFEYEDKLLRIVLKPILIGRNIENIFKYYHINKPNYLPKIYDYEIFGQENKCWYLMEKLIPLDYKEKQSLEKITIYSKSKGKVGKPQLKFLRKWDRIRGMRRCQPFSYNHLMKDSLGRYKIIDLDTLMLT